MHKRSEATAALPPEIRQVVDQLVRERATTGDPIAVGTPDAQQPAAPLTPTSHGLRKPASTPTSPVSASPRPVERRAAAAPEPASQPTIIPPAAAAAPAFTPTPESAPELVATPDAEGAGEPSLLQRTRRMISMPLRRPRADVPPTEDAPAETATPAPTDAPIPAIDDAAPVVDAPEPESPQPIEEAATPEIPAVESTATATDAPAVDTPAQTAPDASSGPDIARIASDLIGQPPIVADLAPAPAPASAGPRQADVAAQPAEPDSPSTPAEPVSATNADQAPASKPSTPAGKSVRPRSGKRGGKRRRGSLAWESARPRTPIEADHADRTAKAGRAAATTPDTIARLDAPLHAPFDRTNDEPRFTRQRAVARRSELDVALSDLSAFVDTTTSRRS